MSINSMIKNILRFLFVLASLRTVHSSINDAISNIQLEMGDHNIYVDGMNVTVSGIQCTNLTFRDIDFRYRENGGVLDVNSIIEIDDIGVQCNADWSYSFSDFNDNGEFYFESEHSDVENHMFLKLSKNYSSTIVKKNICESKLDLKDMRFYSDGISSWVLNQMKPAIVSIFSSDIEDIFCDILGPFMEKYTTGLIDSSKKLLLDEGNGSKTTPTSLSSLPSGDFYDLERPGKWLRSMLDAVYVFIENPKNVEDISTFLENIRIPLNTEIYSLSAFEDTFSLDVFIESVKFIKSNVSNISPLIITSSHAIETSANIRQQEIELDLILNVRNSDEKGVYNTHSEHIHIKFNLDNLAVSMLSLFPVDIARVDEIPLSLLFNAYGDGPFNITRVTERFTDVCIHCIIPSTTFAHVQDIELDIEFVEPPVYELSSSDTLLEIVQQVSDFMFDYYGDSIKGAVSNIVSSNMVQTINDIIQSNNKSCDMYDDSSTRDPNILSRMINDFYNTNWVDITSDILVPLTKDQSGTEGMIEFGWGNHTMLPYDFRLERIRINNLDTTENITFNYETGSNVNTFGFDSSSIEVDVDMRLNLKLDDETVYENAFNVHTTVSDVSFLLQAGFTWNEHTLYDLRVGQINIDCMLQQLLSVNVYEYNITGNISNTLTCVDCDLEILQRFQNTSLLGNETVDFIEYMNGYLLSEKTGHFLHNYLTRNSHSCSPNPTSVPENSDDNMIRPVSYLDNLGFSTGFAWSVIPSTLLCYGIYRLFFKKIHGTKIEPMLTSQKTTVFARICFVLLLLSNFATFILGHTLPGATVYIHGNLGNDGIHLPNIVTFSLMQAYSILWNTDAKLVAMSVIFFSGIWPYLKLCLLTLAAIYPFYEHGKRHNMLRVLGYLGKWSLIELLLMLLVVNSFNMQLQHENLLSAEIKVLPRMGLLIHCLSTFLSMITNSALIYMSGIIKQSELYRNENGSIKTEVLSLDADDKRRNVYAIWLYGISLVCLCLGAVTPIFSFHGTGVANLLQRDSGLENIESYTLFTLASSFYDTSGFDLSIGKLGVFSVLAVYILPICIVPIMHITMQILRVLRMKTSTVLKSSTYETWSQSLSSFCAIEVFITSILVCVWQLSSIAGIIIDPVCSFLNPFMDYIMHPLGMIQSSTCYNVSTEINYGVYFLLAHWILYTVACIVYTHPYFKVRVKSPRGMGDIALSHWA